MGTNIDIWDSVTTNNSTKGWLEFQPQHEKKRKKEIEHPFHEGG